MADPEPRGPLVVNRPGTVMVATDAMFVYLDSLDRIADRMRAAAREVHRLPVPVTRPGEAATPVIWTSMVETDRAAGLINRAGADAAELHDALRTAIERYSQTERDAAARQRGLEAWAAATSAPLLRAAIVMSLLAAAAAFLARPLDRLLFGTDVGTKQLGAWMLAHPGLITNPAFVAFVRGFGTSLDDAVGGLAGAPPGVTTLLGDEGLGVFGVDTNAGLVIGLGGLFGLFHETPVRADRVQTGSPATAPVGAEQRLGRVPEVDQVRVEKYASPGLPPRYVVYVGPTETFSPRATTEPWDLTSNVAGVAGQSAGSFRATEQAMTDAGIGSGDEVAFVGFSQGGLIATMLAGSGDWNARGLETYGAPAGAIPLPADLPGMAVRNSDDFVPALGGPQVDDSRLQVERQAYPPGSVIPTDHPAPAHQRSAYVTTAQAIDRAGSAQVREQVDAMDAFTGDYTGRDGSTITSYRYHAVRLPDGVPGAGIPAAPVSPPSAVR